MTRFRNSVLHAAMLCVAWTVTARAVEPVRVVTTIKPVHSLAASVMQGVAEPDLLISGGGSPHAYALKPSHARSLESARVVIRVSADLETFLNRPIANLAARSIIVTLDETPGLTLYDAREGGLWENADRSSEHERTGHDEGAHAHGAHDPHLWLDPVNARKLAGRIAQALSEAYPTHAAAFTANAEKLRARLTALDTELRAATESLRGKPYIVFHDAYRYFEERYGLQPAGAVAVSPERIPGARRLKAIRDRIAKAEAICVFAEPQFEPKLIATVTEGTAARRGVLDPLGAGLAPGPGQYFTLMRNLAADLAACLTPAQ
jgi:zinc transport system substrate-binding protein